RPAGDQRGSGVTPVGIRARTSPPRRGHWGMNDYTDHDATALADLVRRRGEVTPAELLDDALAALERVEPTLHGTVHRLEARARKLIAGELSDGPFRGVPFVIKDMDGFLA